MCVQYAFQNLELLMIDQQTIIGVSGIVASVGLSAWSAAASLCAALLTCIYMSIQIYRALKK